jgi:hypothetical protein
MDPDDTNDEEGSTCNLNINLPTPDSYTQHLNETPIGVSSTEGAFNYDDDISEMQIPSTPQVKRSMATSPDDSVQDRASVGSSFMNYTYSDDFGDDSTFGTASGMRQEEVTRSLIVDRQPITSPSSVGASIESRGSDRPSHLNVADIMQSTDGTRSASQKQRRTCIPIWISNASNSIKFVIVMGTAMLIASLALLSITATV